MSLNPSSPPVAAFFQMASQAIGGLGTPALRWDGPTPARQILEARLLLEREQIQLSWDTPSGREQAIVTPDDLLHMVQGKGHRVRWFVVEGYQSFELTDAVAINQWLKKHGLG